MHQHGPNFSAHSQLLQVIAVSILANHMGLTQSAEPIINPRDIHQAQQEPQQTRSSESQFLLVLLVIVCPGSGIIGKQSLSVMMSLVL